MDEYPDNGDVDVSLDERQTASLGASMKLADLMNDEMAKVLSQEKLRVERIRVTGEKADFLEDPKQVKQPKRRRQLWGSGRVSANGDGKRRSFHSAVVVEFDGKVWRPQYGEFQPEGLPTHCFAFEERSPGGPFRAVHLEGKMPLILKD